MSGLVTNIPQVSQTSVILFGGNGYTRSGQGLVADMAYREAIGARIPGGSEDVMFDLAVRQLVKNFQKRTKEMETTSSRL